MDVNLSSSPTNPSASLPSLPRATKKKKTERQRTMDSKRNARWFAKKKAEQESLTNEVNSKRALLNLPSVSLTFDHVCPFKGKSKPNYEPPPEMAARMTPEQVSQWKADQRKKRKAMRQKENRLRKKQRISEFKAMLPELEAQVQDVKAEKSETQSEPPCAETKKVVSDTKIEMTKQDEIPGGANDVLKEDVIKVPDACASSVNKSIIEQDDFIFNLDDIAPGNEDAGFDLDEEDLEFVLSDCFPKESANKDLSDETGPDFVRSEFLSNEGDDNKDLFREFQIDMGGMVDFSISCGTGLDEISYPDNEVFDNFSVIGDSFFDHDYRLSL